MLKNAHLLFSRFIKQGNERSVKAKRNILKMIFFKGANILIGLILIPITIDYVSPTTYGIWLTLSSMIMWFNFFDIGINNGLRNRLTEALAAKDYVLCKKYVSTTYAILMLIALPLMIVLLLLAPHIDWNSLLNINAAEAEGLLTSIYILIIYFCCGFVFNTINIVMLADQQPGDAALRNFLQQLSAVIVIYILTLTTKGNLVLLCLTLCMIPLSICLLFNFTLFSGRYRKFAPSIKSVDFSKAKDIMKLGIQFFIIQIAGVIQYQLINFIILRNFGADDVTSYNVTYKYFSIPLMFWGILTTPIWNAVTDAIAKKDYAWIANMRKKYIKLFLIFSAGTLLMLAVSSIIIPLWVGDKVNISWILSAIVMLYCVAQMFSQFFVTIVNGTGNLKVQTIACCISPLVFLGVCYLGITLGMGIISVIIAAIVCNFNGLILAPIQTQRLLKSYLSHK